MLEGGRRISKIKPYGGDRRRKKLVVVGESVACGVAFAPNKESGLNEKTNDGRESWAASVAFNLGERPHWILDAGNKAF